jgi:hypothetical protein
MLATGTTAGAGGRKVRYTKEQLKNAMYLLLDEVLPSINCKKVKKEGNSDCDRCDTCMMEQYIKRVKSGEMPRIVTGK